MLPQTFSIRFQTIDNVAPIKKIRIKSNTQDWFDNEIAIDIKIIEKIFQKNSKNQILRDYNFYIEAKYNTQKLIKQNKLDF